MGGKRLLCVGVAVLLVTVAIFFADTSKEPSYQGCTLTQWIDNAPARLYGFNPSQSGKNPWMTASNAVQQMGPDAIRCLVRWSGTRSSKLKTSVIKWLKAHPSIHLELRDPWFQRRRAEAGFQLLGTSGAPATTALIKKTYDADPDVRACALKCLQNIEPPPETLFPVCFRLMDDKALEVRRMASTCEDDWEMAMTLRADIKDKQAFLSPLLRWINDPDPPVREHAAKLLHFYFPKEAEKAGVYQKFPELRKTATAATTF